MWASRATRRGSRLPSPALVLAGLALFLSLGGTVYAAKKKGRRIDGRSVRAKSLPGNRVKPRSLPANRLKPGALQTAVERVVVQQGPVTGAEVDELSLGQVPSAAHAEAADLAQSAVDSQTAVDAVNAVNAQKLNGYEAGCLPGSEEFAGDCWQTFASATAVSAPAAATSCAVQGGALPGALELAAFSQQPGITLDGGDEWSSDITNMTETNVFAVVTVAASGDIKFTSQGNTRRYRCVLPLLS